MNTFDRLYFILNSIYYIFHLTEIGDNWENLKCSLLVSTLYREKRITPKLQIRWFYSSNISAIVIILFHNFLGILWETGKETLRGRTWMFRNDYFKKSECSSICFLFKKLCFSECVNVFINLSSLIWTMLNYPKLVNFFFLSFILYKKVKTVF